MRRVRIERAKRKLVSSDRPVHEIAIQIGFASHIRLCEVFKREVGLTPGDYRRERVGSE
jgi:AraC-like DNA-binding protein